MITQLPLFDTGPGPERAKKRVRKMSDRTVTGEQETHVESNGEDKPTTTPKKKAAAKKAAVTAKPAKNGNPKTKKGAKAGATATTDRRGRGRRLFPQNTLEDALKVPLAIKEKNGGEPFAPEDVATACKMGPKSPAYYYLTSSAQAYGLTQGTRDTAEIKLTDLGREIVYPESAEEQRKKKIEAFFNVSAFKQIYDHYKGGTLPEMEYLSSRLTKLSVPEDQHEAFADLFKKNYEYLKLSSGMEELQKDTSIDGVSVTVVGQKSGTYQHHAFVIMPFSEKGAILRNKGFFNEMLTKLLTPACNSLNFRVSTANVSGSDLIHHTIMKNLIEAELVIADLTDHNPNVAFELGVRIALDKPVCILRAQGMGPFFDVDNLMRVFEYDPCLWSSTIERDIPKLTDYIKASWENRDKLPSYMKILTASPQALADAQAAA